MSNENNSLYYYSENGEVLGPFSVQELQGKITPDTLVFNEQGTKWEKASEVQEIFETLFTVSLEGINQNIPENVPVNEVFNDDVVLISQDTLVDNTKALSPSLEPEPSKSNPFNPLIVIFVVLVVIGGGIYTFLKSDYYKWKNATKLYCYISSLKIRSDTTTYSDYNILPKSLSYGEPVSVLFNSKLDPWVNVKIDNLEGLVNSSYLMPEKDFMILAALLDTESKQKQISTSKQRRSLVNHVVYQSSLNSLPVLSWEIVDIDNNYFVKTRKSYYSSNEYAIFILRNGSYEELTIFIYNDRNEVSKKSYTDLSNLEVDDVNNYLRQFDLRY